MTKQKMQPKTDKTTQIDVDFGEAFQGFLARPQAEEQSQQVVSHLELLGHSTA